MTSKKIGGIVEEHTSGTEGESTLKHIPDLFVLERRIFVH